MVPFTQTKGYSPKHEAVLAANPKGQVPVLVDGDVTLYDSTVILEYLEDAYPEPQLYPHDAKARALCRQLELEADEVLLAPVRTLMFRTEPPGPDTARRERQEAEATKARAADRRSIIGGLMQSSPDRRFCAARFRSPTSPPSWWCTTPSGLVDRPSVTTPTCPVGMAAFWPGRPLPRWRPKLPVPTGSYLGRPVEPPSYCTCEIRLPWLGHVIGFARF